MLTTEIKNKIQLLWDRLWAGGLSNPIKAIEQISYLLFMKRLEIFHPEVNEEYKWSNYHELKGHELRERINEVFEYIKTSLANEDEPFAMAMLKANFEIETPSLIEDAIQFIDEIYLKIEKEEEKGQHFQDIQGDVFEYLLKATNEAGKNGQFRTPRHIIQLIAELLDPKIEDENTKICDVTSGSSGFLVGAFQYILKENSEEKILDEENKLEKALSGENLSEHERKKLIEDTFVGFDISDNMVRIGMMNLMMHGVMKPNINNLNTLSSAYEEYEEKKFLEKVNEEALRSKAKKTISKKALKTTTENTTPGKEIYTYILANPPFAAKVNSKNISKNLNRIYTISEDPKKATPLQTELLFIERIIFMLKKEGKAAVIIPEGVLFNAGKAYKRTRELILKDCDLHAVISLPSGVFNPYTAVKTSILIFTKKEFNSTVYHTKKVWFYGMESDGYTLDTNRKKINGDFPLPLVRDEYKKKKEKPQIDRKKTHFNIPISKIIENGLELNYNLYKEYVYEEQDYEEPSKLIEILEKLNNEASIGLNNLIKDFK
jgi:type I restriction enzyme M protein